MFMFSILVMSWVTECQINLQMEMKCYTKWMTGPWRPSPIWQIFIALAISLNVPAVIIKAAGEAIWKCLLRTTSLLTSDPELAGSLRPSPIDRYLSHWQASPRSGDGIQRLCATVYRVDGRIQMGLYAGWWSTYHGSNLALEKQLMREHNQLLVVRHTSLD